jgi:hypothetical protein
MYKDQLEIENKLPTNTGNLRIRVLRTTRLDHIVYNHVILTFMTYYMNSNWLMMAMSNKCTNKGARWGI